MRQEIQNVLKLLKSSEPDTRKLGTMLFEHYKESSIIEEIINQKVGYQCFPEFSSVNTSFTYIGEVSQQVVSNMIGKVSEIINEKRRSIHFKSNVQKMKYGKQTMEFSFWLFNFLQKYVTKEISFLFDQPHGSQEAVVLLRESVDVENMIAKMSSWRSFNNTLVGLNDKEKVNARAIKKRLNNDVHAFALIQLVAMPAEFLVLPSKRFNEYLLIQKITVNFFNWHQDFVDVL